MSALRLVALREMRESVRHRAFWVINAVLFVGALAAVTIPSLIHSGSGTDRVATTAVPADFVASVRAVRAATHTKVRFVEVSGREAGRQSVDDGHTDIAVIGGSDPEIIVRSGQHTGLVAAAQQALAATTVEARLHTAGVAPDVATQILDVHPARVDGLNADAGGRRAAAAIVATVLYVLLLGLTISVANGVAVEKSNRISEVLLAIVPPRPLLFGKVVGTGLMGIATLLFGIIPVATRLAIGGGLPTGLGAVLATGGAWFVLGIAFYLVVAGALAALVERPEQAGSAMGPLMAALVASLIVSQSAPDSGIAKVLVYVPFCSPILEPARVAVGASSRMEMVLSLLILLGAVAIAARVGGLVFQRAVVRTGRRLKLREVLRPA